jgi:hypothetical protein
MSCSGASKEAAASSASIQPSILYSSHLADIHYHSTIKTGCDTNRHFNSKSKIQVNRDSIFNDRKGRVEMRRPQSPEHKIVGQHSNQPPNARINQARRMASSSIAIMHDESHSSRAPVQ